MIKRLIFDHIQQRLFKNKVILLFGPRQVGKTTLLKKIASECSEPFILLNGDEPDIRELFRDASSTVLKNLFGSNKLILIDEAQRIEQIGLKLKLAFDNIPGIQIIATGSSSFELANMANEPLTGRKFEYHLYPFSFEELAAHSNELEEKRLLNERLIYGSYPDVVNNPDNKLEILNTLTNSYLYKDLFLIDGIKKSTLFEKLAKALALQLGQEVSYNELAQLLGVDKNTVEKYIDLMEQAYIIHKLPALSRNVRNELKKGKKIYFYDNGIRNAIIGNFTNIELRTDKGALWENYLISERKKFNEYHNKYGSYYFWRTSQQQEIDYIEEIDGIMHAYEFKWSPSKSGKIPLTFSNSYSPTVYSTINTSNYPEFLQ